MAAIPGDGGPPQQANRAKRLKMIENHGGALPELEQPQLEDGAVEGELMGMKIIRQCPMMMITSPRRIRMLRSLYRKIPGMRLLNKCSQNREGEIAWMMFLHQC